MTLEDIAVIKTFTAAEHGLFWDRFYDLAPEGDHIAPENRSALEDLIREAPLHITRYIPHVRYNEFVGYYPWRRDNGTVGLVLISLCPNNNACMCDTDASDLAYYLSTRVE